MNSSRMISTRKNAAQLRHEAQCQARFKRNQFVLGLLLGFVVLALFWFARSSDSTNEASQHAAIATSTADHPLLVIYGKDVGPHFESQGEDENPQR